MYRFIEILVVLSLSCHLLLSANFRNSPNFQLWACAGGIELKKERWNGPCYAAAAAAAAVGVDPVSTAVKYKYIRSKDRAWGQCRGTSEQEQLGAQIKKKQIVALWKGAKQTKRNATAAAVSSDCTHNKIGGRRPIIPVSRNGMKGQPFSSSTEAAKVGRCAVASAGINRTFVCVCVGWLIKALLSTAAAAAETDNKRRHQLSNCRGSVDCIISNSALSQHYLQCHSACFALSSILNTSVQCELRIQIACPILIVHYLTKEY